MEFDRANEMISLGYFLAEFIFIIFFITLSLIETLSLGKNKGVEPGLLKMPLDQCQSLRYNPFYDYMYQHAMEWFLSEDAGETASSFRQH